MKACVGSCPSDEKRSCGRSTVAERGWGGSEREVGEGSEREVGEESEREVGEGSERKVGEGSEREVGGGGAKRRRTAMHADRTDRLWSIVLSTGGLR